MEIGLYRGVRMDITRELNLRSCRTYFQKAGRSEYTRPVNLGQDHFQYRLKSLENENFRDRDIATVSLSRLRATITPRILVKEGIGKSKVLKDRVLAWQGIET